MRRALVTGATGFIGWHLASHLAGAGWHVRALVPPGRNRALPPGVEPSLAAFEASAIARAAVDTDVVFHLAGLMRGHPRALHAVNVGLTREAAGAARTLGARFVYVSSQSVAGPAPPSRPSRETDPPDPRTPYASTKLAAERLVADTPGLAWTIVRPTIVYGPRDTQFLPLLRLARYGWSLAPRHRDAQYNFVFVDDVVRGLMAAASSPAASGGTFFVGHRVNSGIGELAGALAAALGRPVRSLTPPLALMRAAALAGEAARAFGMSAPFDRSRLIELTAPGFACSTALARERLGFESATDLEEGMRRTLAWYRAEGWLR